EATAGLLEPLPGRGCVVCVTDSIRLTAGRCHLDVGMKKAGGYADWVDDAASFDVEADDFYGSGRIPNRDWVLCVIPHEWRAEDLHNADAPASSARENVDEVVQP